jgi:hypothetical protein
VRAPSMNDLRGPASGCITGLTPEQATQLKSAIEDAFTYGRGHSVWEMRRHLDTEMARGW